LHVTDAAPDIGLNTRSEREEQTGITGGCHCRAIRYQAEGEALTTRCVMARMVGGTPVRRRLARRCNRKVQSR
jgi:hypothetical protein